jgi:hypothetical protein
MASAQADMQRSTCTQDHHRNPRQRGGMTQHRLRLARRVQAAVIALGVAGSLGAAAAIGLTVSASPSAGTNDPGTDRPQSGTWSRGYSDDDGGGDDEGGSQQYGQTQPQGGQLQAPLPAPQPPSGGGSHATTSGS